jgi:hypothetical protein
MSSGFTRIPSGGVCDRSGTKNGLARWRWPLAPAPAIFDLNGPAHYVHWHFFQMSVANVTVLLLMIAVFVAAILLPFPHRGPER